MTLLKSSDSWKEVKDLKHPLETRYNCVSSLAIGTLNMKPGSVWSWNLWTGRVIYE